MAGKAGPKAENDKLRERIERLERDLSDTRRLLAAVDPSAFDKLDGARPAPLGDITPDNVQDVSAKVEAMAGEGMQEAQWIAALGLTQSQWGEGVKRFPTLGEAVARARMRLRGHLQGAMQRAIDNRDNRFPVHVYKAMLATLDTEDDGEGGSGDASKLVLLDLRASQVPIASKAIDTAEAEPQKTAIPEKMEKGAK